MSSCEWDVHYRNERPPWENGRPSSELQSVIVEQRIKPCRVIDLGCGSGINAVWLTEQSFDVTAVDLSPLAIEQARRRAATAGVRVDFVVADLLTLPNRYEPFPFFFDRGCYHAVRRHDGQGYVRMVHGVTAPGAIGLMLAGNAKEPHAKGQGPPVVSEQEIRAEWEPAFKIVRLREFRFDRSDADPAPFLGWSCLLRRVD